MGHYYFYILFSSILDKYYLSHTFDLTERLRRHNANHKGFTGKENDWQIIYIEEYHTKEAAYQRELQVKNWKNRLRIEALVRRGSEHLSS